MQKIIIVRLFPLPVESAPLYMYQWLNCSIKKTKIINDFPITQHKLYIHDKIQNVLSYNDHNLSQYISYIYIKYLKPQTFQINVHVVGGEKVVSNPENSKKLEAFFFLFSFRNTTVFVSASSIIRIRYSIV